MSAVFPGAGQIYNGSYQSALFSFVLNSIFLSATLEFHDQKMAAAALASGALFSVFYVGGITSSVETSRAINKEHNRMKVDALRDEIFPELKN